MEFKNKQEVEGPEMQYKGQDSRISWIKARWTGLHRYISCGWCVPENSVTSSFKLMMTVPILNGYRD